MDDPRTEAERLAEEAALVANYDQLKAAYEAAHAAHVADPNPENTAALDEAMKAVAGERSHWRGVGEVTGVRAGTVKTEDGV